MSRQSVLSLPLCGVVGAALMAIQPVNMAYAQDDNNNDTEQFAQCACKDILSPTQVANAFWTELAAADDFDKQIGIVSKHLNLVTIDSDNMPQDRLSRLALGEGTYLTFQVDLTNAYFSTLLEGDDLIARHAWTRMMQITNRALGKPDEAMVMVKQFYQKFPPSEINKHGRYQQIRNFVSGYLEAGKTDEAIALIIEELNMLPTNAPYTSYGLLRAYDDQIKASARQNDVVKIVKAKLGGLKALDKKWSKDTYLASDDPVISGEMPLWYWRQQGVKPGETLRAARQRELTALIAGLETWLASSSRDQD